LRDLLRAHPGRLSGTKVVVWQFAERELAVGDWKMITLPEAAPEVRIPTAGPQDPREQHPPQTPDPAQEGAAAAVISAEQALAELGAMGLDALAEDAAAIEGKDEWLFLSTELRHLGAGPFWGEHAADASQARRDPDPMAAIVDFDRKLDALGIRLVLMPVPPRAVVYADKLLDGLPADDNGVPQRIDIHHQRFYELLRKEGIKVIDLTEAFLAARGQDAALGPVCLQQDTHWSPRGLGIAVARLNEALAEDAWLEGATRQEFHRFPDKTIDITGDLVDRVPDYGPSITQVTIAQVSASPDTLQPVARDIDSPLLLLTDSHGLVFHSGGDMHTEAAGISDHLALTLGLPVDLMAQRGSGAAVRIALARRFLGDPTAAARKRVLVYCFAARAFTESDAWRLVPLSR
jgi:alginate O-acetyltransferase complex protein AlgJ